MPKTKHILIGLVVFVILAAALLIALNNQKIRPMDSGISQTDNFGSSALPSVPVPMGVPERSGGIMSKNLSEVTPSVSSDISFGQDIPDKKVIKNGNLTLKVDNADRSAEKISQIAKDNDGEIFSSNFYENAKNIKSGSITVKVPVANFEKTFSELKKVATLVVQESTSGQDVTEEYADLQSQLKNKQAEEQQFVQILGQAQKIQDILDVTQELSRVRGEVETLQGRIKFLNSQTDMASISISLTEDTNITLADSWRPWQVVKNSVNALVKKAQGFVDFVIVLVIAAIPLILLYALLVYVIYRIGRKIYLKIKEKRDDLKP
ncbi:MAG TPA: DUF4349 domain-containing protein [Patescibacteria group bacterium]